MGEFEVKDPFVMGHESSGTVLECGANVTSLKPGDRVAIAPNMSCLRCEFCVTGHWNLCKLITKGFMASDKGSLCQYYRHPADYCYK
ncbi:Alcohol dehydrogenase N-terminal [Trinorchestia longiramus]|nr:Alcohol dehydrogenase N-terminal [Trinorchestia longiramus]